MKIGQVEIDKAGRLVLPKQIRDLCQIQAGEKLDIYLEGTRITLQPECISSGIFRKEGLLVFRNEGNEGQFSAQEELDKSREERLQSFISPPLPLKKRKKRK